jgi:translocation and assembly module TamB
VLARLLFGRSAGALSPLEGAMLARSLSTLTGGGGGGLLAFDPITDIRQAVGLDVLRIDMADGGSPVVETGQYVADGVFVGVRQGAAAGTGSVVVEIELFDTVTVDSRVRPDGGNDVGIKFRWDY